MELFPPSAELNEFLPSDHECVKAALENYITVCGLVAFKDFFMKVKTGVIDSIPDSVTLEEYLTICREVFQARAGRIERQKVDRRKYFANRNKKRKP